MARQTVEVRIIEMLGSATAPLCKHDFKREFAVSLTAVERALAKLRDDGDAIRVAKWHRDRVTAPYTPYYTLADGRPDAPPPILGQRPRVTKTTLPSDPLTMFVLRPITQARKAAG